MRNRTIRRRGEGSGGFGCLIVVVLVIVGILWYLQKGGKIFGPGAMISYPEVVGLSADFDTGAFSHDLLLKNESGTLEEVDLIITFYREDGEKPIVKQFWSSWPVGQTKKVNVPAHNYQKVTLAGRAIQNSERRHINSSWTWTWGRNK